MTLRQQLRKLEPGTKIKLGAINGTAYFYVGTNDDLESKFAEYDEQIMRMWRKKLQNAKDSLRVLLNSTVTIESYVTSQLRRPEKPDLTIEGYKAHVENCLRQVRFLHHTLVQCRDVINNPIPLSVRPVVDCLKNTIKEEREYINIRIEGYEAGTFWSSDETAKKPVMKFNLTDAELASDIEEGENGAEI